MSEGSLIEFLLAQGLSPAKSVVIKDRFYDWMRRSKHDNGLPGPVSRRDATNVYRFSDLEPCWADYKAMRAERGREIS